MKIVAGIDCELFAAHLLKTSGMAYIERVATTSEIRDGNFALTRWSVVLAAAEATDTAQSREALETLCRHYWYPLYAYVRRQNANPDEAQELKIGGDDAIPF